MALPPPSLLSTVLVTGASSGIGAELARQLAQRGYNVTLTARRKERLDELAGELRAAHGVRVEVEPCDLGDRAERKALIERMKAGELEVVGVCNNAGLGFLGPFHELPLEREAGVVAVNVEAVHELTGAFLPRMVKQGTGAVLNVASTSAFQPLPGFATYAASKAFVVSFSEAVHSELSGTGVSVTALCPGFTRTEFGEAAGTPKAEDKLPDFTLMDADDVARHGIDAMVAGRRSSVPGLLNKLTSTTGRHVPRTILLPIIKRVQRARSDD
jgi:short-subunit dehydrogenase